MVFAMRRAMLATSYRSGRDRWPPGQRLKRAQRAYRVRSSQCPDTMQRCSPSAWVNARLLFLVRPDGGRGRLRSGVAVPIARAAGPGPPRGQSSKRASARPRYCFSMPAVEGSVVQPIRAVVQGIDAAAGAALREHDMRTVANHGVGGNPEPGCRRFTDPGGFACIMTVMGRARAVAVAGLGRSGDSKRSTKRQSDAD